MDAGRIGCVRSPLGSVASPLKRTASVRSVPWPRREISCRARRFWCSPTMPQPHKTLEETRAALKHVSTSGPSLLHPSHLPRWRGGERRRRGPRRLLEWAACGSPSDPPGQRERQMRVESALGGVLAETICRPGSAPINCATFARGRRARGSAWSERP